MQSEEVIHKLFTKATPYICSTVSMPRTFQPLLQNARGQIAQRQTRMARAASSALSTGQFS